MDVERPWRRKRSAEDDQQYLASKRYISEKFFNMRISHPHLPRRNSAGSAWEGMRGRAAGGGSGDFGKKQVDDGMSDTDEELLEGEGAACETSSSSSEAGGGPATPHPFARSASASSAVDEKVEDWVRSSRHRMLADASINSSPDLCRALVVYKPLAPPMGPSGLGAAAVSGGEESGEEDADESGEGGGDPTPSPQAGGHDGGKTAPSAAASGRGLGAINPNSGGGRSTFTEQSAGSSTAEAAMSGSSFGGKARNGFANCFANGFANGPHHAIGLCTAQSGGDDAGGGTMLLAREDSVQMQDDGDVGTGGGSSASVSASVSADTDADADAMDLDAAGDDGAGVGVAAAGLATWEMQSPLPPASAPALTRAGRSRGAPTPDLTPQRVAWAREANQRRQGRRQNQNQNQDQDPEEMGMGMGMTSSAVVSAGATSASAAGASSSNDPRPPLTAQSWAKW